ncbi:peptidase S8 [Actinomadura sp. KC216]|nr:peptidase S8 [Actinomadura sp. KC216]
MALLMIGLVAWPGSAAAAPRPLPREWWFKSWGVQSHLWPLSTGEGVTVALLDTGVQADLPELQGVVLPGMNAEGGGGDGREDLDKTSEYPGHGTGMAALIAGQGGGTGMVGVAPDVKILPIITQSREAFTKGIRYAVDHGAQVVNLSQATPGRCDEELQESVAYALGKGAVIVAGAGNDGELGNVSNSPANCKGVLAVGAVDGRGNPWEKTQRQPYVMVAAPGVETVTVLRDGNLYPGSGTSDAAALTSAAVALIRAKHPQMTNREVVRQLIASAADLYKKGKDDRTGYGMIRPYRPLAGKVPQGTANPVFDEFDRWMKLNHPVGAKSAAPKASDEGAPVSAIVFFAAVAGVVVLCIFGFLFSRRKSRSPAPMGPGHGAPPGFGQQYPPGPPPAAQPMGGRPQYQPPGQPGGAPPPAPPGWGPPEGWPPGQRPR